MYIVLKDAVFNRDAVAGIRRGFCEFLLVRVCQLSVGFIAVDIVF